MTILTAPLSEGDARVLARIANSRAGASALDIARASLGTRARKHSVASLDLVGLSVAARLCGQGLIEPVHVNRFRLAQRSAS